MKTNKIFATLLIALMAMGTMQAQVSSLMRVYLTGNANSNSQYVTLRKATTATYATAFLNTESSAAYEIYVRANSDYYSEWQATDLTNTMIAVNPAVGTTQFTLRFKLGSSNTETFTFFDKDEMSDPIVVANNYEYEVTLPSATTAREWILNRFYINYVPAVTETLPGKIGTFIRSKNITNVEGGLFYEITNGDTEHLSFQSLANEDALAKATPVLYVADAAGSMVVTYGNDVYAGDATATIAHQGFVGLIDGSQVCSNASGTDAALINSTGCIVYAAASFTLTAGHAYIDLNNLPSVTPAPGRRRLVIGRNGIVTGVEDVVVEANATKKVMIDGVMYIMKNGALYDMMGQVVK